MKITIDHELLSQATANISRVVASKSTIPALEGILIEAGHETVTMSGYDLEMGMMRVLPAAIRGEGGIVLPARLLADIVRRLEGGQVVIETDEKDNCVITCGHARFDLSGINSGEYPELPDIDRQNEYAFSTELFKSVVRQTIFSVATNDSKPVYMGIMFDIKDELLTVVGVDGYRLAVRHEQVSGTINNSFIVPAKAVSEVIKILSDNNEEVKLYVGSRHICFEVEGYTVISRLLDGEFLDYMRVMPKEVTTCLRLNTRMVMDTIDRISPIINDKTKSPVRVTIRENTFMASCATQIGRADDEFEVEIDGEELEIGFNNRYILDALKATETDEVIMEFSGPLSPIVIKPTEGDSFLFLVLPVRLKNG